MSVKHHPLTIGIDLDDTLLDFNSTLCEFHNQKYGTNYKRSDITKYRLDDIWNATYEQIVERIDEFYHTDLHWNSAPMEGAPEVIRELQKKHRLIIITAKPDYLREKTLMWLDKHYKDAFKEIHFLGEFHGTSDHKKKSKGELCDEIGVDIFIEDSMANAKNIARLHRPVLLLDSPWNQGELPENVKRVKGWVEVVNYILSK